ELQERAKMETDTMSLSPASRHRESRGYAASPFANGKLAVGASPRPKVSSAGKARTGAAIEPSSNSRCAAQRGGDPGQGFVDPWRGC
ncbi:MAG: hypothetical protein ACLFU3_08860, partial [Dichotomicrobium sp.]